MNLLTVPTNWSDYDGVSPPSYLSGDDFDYTAPGGGGYFRMTLLATPEAGDRIQATVTGGGFSSAAYLNYVTTGDVVVQTWPMDGTPQEIDLAAVPGRFVLGGSGAANPGTVYNGTLSIVPLDEFNDPVNCDCDDSMSINRTLGEMVPDLMILLGYGAQVGNPPPSMVQMLQLFLRQAQVKLYGRLLQKNWVRFFSWPLQAGVVLYDFPDNMDACARKIDPRHVTWVGIEIDGIWRPMAEGIAPELNSHDITAQWPTRYEFRQCIQIWPKPADTRGRLIIKGGFGLMPLVADSDRTTVASDLVFQQALADAKSHYRKPDADVAQQQLEVMLRNYVAGEHQTARYIPGRRYDQDAAYAYDWPIATPPFPGSL